MAAWNSDKNDSDQLAFWGLESPQEAPSEAQPVTVVNDAPRAAPDHNTRYLCFTLDTDENQAAQRFEARHGYPPAEILEYKRLLWLGPVE